MRIVHPDVTQIGLHNSKIKEDQRYLMCRQFFGHFRTCLWGHHCNSPDFVFDHRAHGSLSPFRVILSRAQKEVQTPLHNQCFEGFHKFGKERILDVRNDEAKEIAAAPSQTPSMGILVIVELSNSFQHPPSGFRTIRSPSFSNLDFSLIKDTKITEKITLQFRSEFFNLLNQHAFRAPVEVLGASGFGKANATVLPERQIQFGLRLIF